jgi:CheY-like chemotaxis protein
LAKNGIEAVDKFQTSNFDLILMDCQMPEMDGFEATAEIRALEKLKGSRTPIVALTANAFRETKEKCFECGMDDFMTKPFKISDIQQVFQRMGGGRR